MTVIVDGHRPCIMCKAIKPLTDFYLCAYITSAGNASQRHDSRCKPCNRTRRQASWRIDNAAKVARGRAYKQANREAINAQQRAKRLADLDAYRAAKRTSETLRKYKLTMPRGHAVALTRRVLEEARVGDKYIDAYDGTLIDKPEVDHIVPLSRGGKHEYENLCVTSKKNNSRKHAQPMLYWLCSRRAA